MRKIKKESTYKSIPYDERVYVLCITDRFVSLDVSRENYPVIQTFPTLKNTNNMFWSEDKKYILFLNTTGSGFIYDVEQKRKLVICLLVRSFTNKIFYHIEVASFMKIIITNGKSDSPDLPLLGF